MIFVILIVKGIILGCTAIIPGISIGTMALVLDVYGEAIDSFTIICNINKWSKQTIIRLCKFFFPLAIGIVIAMIAFATLLTFLLDTYPTFVQFGFIGIILGSIPYIYKEHIKKHLSIKSLPFILLGASIILFFAFSDNISRNIDSTSHITLSTTAILLALLFGIISAACGLIPGISGSFVLLILGYYTSYLTIIKDVFIPLLIPLLIGHLIGFILVSFVLKTVLTKYPFQAYSVILGLILASIIGIFPWKSIQVTFSNDTFFHLIINICIAVLCLLLGVGLSRLCLKKSP